VPYQGDQEQIIREAVWFVLRGFGLKTTAIAAHYDAEKLAEYARSFAQPPGETSLADAKRPETSARVKS